MRKFGRLTAFASIAAASGFLFSLSERVEAGGKAGTVYDDSIKPVPGEKATIFDDSIKPADPAKNPKATIFDDSVKPVDPNKPPKVVNDKGATAIEYAKPSAIKPEQK